MTKIHFVCERGRTTDRNRDVGKIDGFQKQRIRVLSKSESRSIKLLKDYPHMLKNIQVLLNLYLCILYNHDEITAIYHKRDLDRHHHDS